jgi:hypothetical protein
MYDACRGCTLPKMRMCARTSNMKRTNTERTCTQERKVGHRGCAGRGNVVARRRKWQQALQMIQPSECTCPGVRGRQRGVLRGISNRSHSAGREETRRGSKNRRRAARSDEVRWPGAREKRCRLPTRMPARRVPGRTTTGLDSFVRPSIICFLQQRWQPLG